MQRRSFTTSHKQTDVYPVSEQRLPPQGSLSILPPLSLVCLACFAKHGIICHRISLGYAWISCTIGCVPSQLLAHPWPAHYVWQSWEKGKALILHKYCSATAQTMVLLTLLVTNPKHSTIQPAVKKLIPSQPDSVKQCTIQAKPAKPACIHVKLSSLGRDIYRLS